MNKAESKNYCRPVIIHERKIAFWDYEISQKNLEFINQIDPAYFDFIAEINLNLINSEETSITQKQYAATNLRTAYSQALEVLFSFLFATLQAPHCVIGWILKYSNDDLQKVVKDFSNEENLHIGFHNEIKNWNDLSNLVFDFLDTNQKQNEQNKILGFAELWKNFALDFLEEKTKNEYNSIKHGLRLGMQGHQLSVGPIENSKSCKTDQNFRKVVDNPYGSSFYTTEKIDNYNFVIHQHFKNWNPENFFSALKLISTSIKNIILFLNKSKENQMNLQYDFPEDENFYKKPWSIFEKSELNIRSRIVFDNPPLLTKDEITIAYQKSE